MTRLPSALAAAAVLVLAGAAPAGAKELSAARACDVDRCNTVTSHGQLAALIDLRPAAAPERRAPFHRVRLTVDDPDGSDVHFTIAYIPALRLVREQPSINGETLWTQPPPRAIRVLDRLTHGLEPVPARRLRGIAAPTAAAAPATPPSPPPDADDGGGAAWLLVLLAPVLAGLGWAARRRHPRLRPRRA